MSTHPTETDVNDFIHSEEKKENLQVESTSQPEEQAVEKPLFSDLSINENILQALENLGFKHPTPIQEKVIPILLQPEAGDVLGLAQTGTGKTAAFGVPIVQKVDVSKKQVQALILAPTRELCLQIADDIKTFSKYTPNLNIAAVFGGASIERQIKAVKKNAQIVSATPGRLNDLIRRKAIDLSQIKTLVLDEADEMLNMGFREELETILAETPKQKQTLLFSATMPKEIRGIAETYMQKPVEIRVGNQGHGADKVNHVCYVVQSRDRLAALKRIVDSLPELYGIVFCRTRVETQEVAERLMKDGYQVDALHGDLSQAMRDVVLNKFKARNLKLLVATDVAARGLDVDDLTHVINYNLPDELEVYIHRSGRTGRAGRAGTSIMIINLKEKFKLNRLEKLLDKRIEIAQIPNGIEICHKQLLHLVDRLEKVEADDSAISALLPDIMPKFEWLDREEIIKKFIALEFNRFMDYYKKVPDIHSAKESDSSRGERGERSDKSGRYADSFAWLQLNAGKNDGLRPVDLIGFINDLSGVRNIKIGRIILSDKETKFEIDSLHTTQLIKAAEEVEINERQAVLKSCDPVADDRPPRRGGGDRSNRSRERSRNGRSFSSNRNQGDRRDRNRGFGDRSERRPRRDRH